VLVSPTAVSRRPFRSSWLALVRLDGAIRKAAPVTAGALIVAELTALLELDLEARLPLVALVLRDRITHGSQPAPSSNS